MSVLRSHILTVRILAVLAALLMVLPLSGAQSTQFFCRMMKRVTSSCCCAPGHAGPLVQRDDCGPRVAPQSCCARVQRAERAAPPALRDAAPQVPAPFLASVLPSTELVSPMDLRDAVVAPIQARAPPRPSAPIFLLNCALLT